MIPVLMLGRHQTDGFPMHLAQQQAPVTLDALSAALASVIAAAAAPLGSALTFGPSRAATHAPHGSQQWAQAPQQRTSPLPGAVRIVSANAGQRLLCRRECQCTQQAAASAVPPCLTSNRVPMLHVHMYRYARHTRCYETMVVICAHVL